MHSGPNGRICSATQSLWYGFTPRPIPALKGSPLDGNLARTMKI